MTTTFLHLPSALLTVIINEWILVRGSGAVEDLLRTLVRLDVAWCSHGCREVWMKVISNVSVEEAPLFLFSDRTAAIDGFFDWVCQRSVELRSLRINYQSLHADLAPICPYVTSISIRCDPAVVRVVSSDALHALLAFPSLTDLHICRPEDDDNRLLPSRNGQLDASDMHFLAPIGGNEFGNIGSEESSDEDGDSEVSAEEVMDEVDGDDDDSDDSEAAEGITTIPGTWMHGGSMIESSDEDEFSDESTEDPNSIEGGAATKGGGILSEDNVSANSSEESDVGSGEAPGIAEALGETEGSDEGEGEGEGGTMIQESDGGIGDGSQAGGGGVSDVDGLATVEELVEVTLGDGAVPIQDHNNTMIQNDLSESEVEHPADDEESEEADMAFTPYDDFPFSSLEVGLLEVTALLPPLLRVSLPLMETTAVNGISEDVAISFLDPHCEMLLELNCVNLTRNALAFMVCRLCNLRSFSMRAPNRPPLRPFVERLSALVQANPQLESLTIYGRGVAIPAETMCELMDVCPHSLLKLSVLSTADASMLVVRTALGSRPGLRLLECASYSMQLNTDPPMSLQVLLGHEPAELVHVKDVLRAVVARGLHLTSWQTHSRVRPRASLLRAWCMDEEAVSLLLSASRGMMMNLTLPVNEGVATATLREVWTTCPRLRSLWILMASDRSVPASACGWLEELCVASPHLHALRVSDRWLSLESLTEAMVQLHCTSSPICKLDLWDCTRLPAAVRADPARVSLPPHVLRYLPSVVQPTPV